MDSEEYLFMIKTLYNQGSYTKTYSQNAISK